MTDNVVFPLLLLLVALAATNTVATIGFVLWRLRYRIDAGRIAGVMAADLLERGDANTLTETAIRTFARERYATMCALFGLPTAAGDAIADRVVAYVAQATGEPPPQWAGELRGLYE